jgi:hypothetical protein
LLSQNRLNSCEFRRRRRRMKKKKKKKKKKRVMTILTDT